MTSRVVFEAIPVVDFVKQHLSRHDLSRNFTEFERNEIMTALRGIKVEVTHCRNQRQKYRIFGLTENATADLTFYDNTGSKRHVVEYFRQTYQCDLKYTHLPCLSVGHKGKKFMPIELCKIVEGQPYSGERDQKLRNEIHRIASVLPSVRHDDICQAVVGNRYGDDPYALEFGISICETLARVEARILPTPELSIRGYKFIPERGRWKLKQMKLLQKGVDRGNKINWSFINFSPEVSVDGADSFFGNLVYCSRVLGMAFSNEATVSDNYGYSGGYEAEAVKTSLKCLYDKAKTKLKGRKLDILIVILPDNNRSIYGDLKRICETDLGIMTQCILSKNVLNPNFEILDFLLLKLNVKAGRTNIVLVAAELKSLPLVGDGPTIIFGADVNHPGPGDDRNPSIAAVVASRDWPNMSKYVARVSAQLPGHELIENLCSMIREHLESFKKANGLPNRIIYYRDGVSETQFDDLLNIEGEAIRQACDLVASNYKPKITFVVVQKRHHVRLFPFDFNDSEVVKNHGNILPGTVVDSRICRQTWTDFFLCSHSSTEGTSRPTHYNVLLDENNFDRVQLQWLTNDLCYTFARCMSSTSVVPPVLYADSAAYRATFHLEPKTESVALRTLLPLTESLREEMYYI